MSKMGYSLEERDMSIEATCGKCTRICCYKDGFHGRVIVLDGTELTRNSAIPIEKCKMGSPGYPEEGFIKATGWAVYLSNPNPELTLEEYDKQRGISLLPLQANLDQKA
jgi:hypothetical protein